MTLKIDRVEVFGVAMPLTHTFTSGGVSKSATKCVAVRLTAADGTVGISSIDPSTAASSPQGAGVQGMPRGETNISRLMP